MSSPHDHHLSFDSSLESDFEEVATVIGQRWTEIRDRKLFLTGGSGFFGKWLIRSWLAAERRYSLNSELYILTRSREQFYIKHPDLRSFGRLKVVEGDIATFEFPQEEFSYVIHAAMPMNKMDNVAVFESAIRGSLRISEFCNAKSVRKLLYISSGAVYGPQPSEIDCLSESYRGNDRRWEMNGYEMGKRASEWLFMNSDSVAKQITEVKIARCFAFAGPYLPLDANYALSNFLVALLEQKPLSLKSDGSAIRSYMYPTDLAVWLWTILFEGRNKEAYNVGSDVPVSVADLAKSLVRTAMKVSKIANPGIEFAKIESALGETKPLPERYVPSIKKARSELGLDLRVDQMTALEKTWNYFRLKIQDEEL